VCVYIYTHNINVYIYIYIYRAQIGEHLPQVENEFESDTSNSTEMWERRDAQVLQYVAVCCSVLQCFAMRCSALWYAAACFSVLG